MKRITMNMLENRIDYLNSLMNRPADTYTRIDGKAKANIGNFYLSCAYGGYCLYEIINEGVGVSRPTSSGHVPARELMTMIDSLISGVHLERQNNEK